MSGRPNPAQWLWYALGGGLPARCDEWVLYDTTGRTWIWRHLARALVQLSIPVAAVLIFIPAPIGLRALTAVAAGGPALMISFGYIVEAAEHRLLKAGYPAGLGEKLRRDRAANGQRTANAARRERIAARAARRSAARTHPVG